MPKLLIIDDEEEISKEVKDFFEEEGFIVFTADSGKEGKNLIRQENPDLVLLDLKLPDVSGLEILEMLRKSFPKSKVIVNTGYVDQSLLDQAKELGYESFLSKPFNLIKLKDEVGKTLNL